MTFALMKLLDTYYNTREKLIPARTRFDFASELVAIGDYLFGDADEPLMSRRVAIAETTEEDAKITRSAIRSLAYRYRIKNKERSWVDFTTITIEEDAAEERWLLVFSVRTVPSAWRKKGVDTPSGGGMVT